MSDANTAPPPGLLGRLAAIWRDLTTPVQADFVGIAPAIEAADREDERRKQEKASEDNEFANYYRWVHH